MDQRVAVQIRRLFEWYPFEEAGRADGRGSDIEQLLRDEPRRRPARIADADIGAPGVQIGDFVRRLDGKVDAGMRDLEARQQAGVRPGERVMVPFQLSWGRCARAGAAGRTRARPFRTARPMASNPPAAPNLAARSPIFMHVPFAMYGKGNSFRTGRVHARAGMPAVLQCCTEGQLHPEIVTTRTVTFEEAPDAMTDGSAKLSFVRA